MLHVAADAIGASWLDGTRCRHGRVPRRPARHLPLRAHQHATHPRQGELVVPRHRERGRHPRPPHGDRRRAHGDHRHPADRPGAGQSFSRRSSRCCSARGSRSRWMSSPSSCTCRTSTGARRDGSRSTRWSSSSAWQALFVLGLNPFAGLGEHERRRQPREAWPWPSSSSSMWSRCCSSLCSKARSGRACSGCSSRSSPSSGRSGWRARTRRGRAADTRSGRRSSREPGGARRGSTSTRIAWRDAFFDLIAGKPHLPSLPPAEPIPRRADDRRPGRGRGPRAGACGRGGACGRRVGRGAPERAED